MSELTNPWEPWQRLIDAIGPYYRGRLFKARDLAKAKLGELDEEEGSSVRVRQRALSDRLSCGGYEQLLTSEARGLGADGNFLETAPSAEASFRSLTAWAWRTGWLPFSRFSMFLRFPSNRTASTRWRETGPDGPSSDGEYPSGAALEARASCEPAEPSAL